MSNRTFQEYLESIQEEFINDLNEMNLQDIMSFIEVSDYFTAPASSKHHLSMPHGLFIHSRLVYKNLQQLNEMYQTGLDPMSMFIVAYFHDLCKCNYYSVENKWRKE